MSELIVDWLRAVHTEIERVAHALQDPPAARARVAAEREILDHHERWQATLRETPEGWTEPGCTAYRMAMSWVVEQLAAGWSTMPGYEEAR